MKKALLPSKPKTIIINYQFTVNFHSWNNLLDQMGNILKNLVHQFIQQTFDQVVDSLHLEAKQYLSIGYFKERLRTIVTPFGPIKIKDYEVRQQGGRYLGRSINFILGIPQKEKLLEATIVYLATLIPKMTYRETAKSLQKIWKYVSHQTLNYWIRTMSSTRVLVGWNEVSKKLKSRLFCWFDGTIIKIREHYRGQVVRETLRIVLRESVKRGHSTIKVAFGFLDHSYSSLFAEVVSENEKNQVIAFSDGEKKIEENLTGLKAYQRCIFHFLWNLPSRLIQEGLHRSQAEKITDELRNIVYLRIHLLRKVKNYYQTIIDQRIKILETYAQDFLTIGLKGSAEYISRAKKYLFTYVRFYCRKDKPLWIGRTSNKIERLMRVIAKRMKRVGAVWSSEGAEKVIMLILIDYLKIPFALTKPPNWALTSLPVVKV